MRNEKRAEVVWRSADVTSGHKAYIDVPDYRAKDLYLQIKLNVKTKVYCDAVISLKLSDDDRYKMEPRALPNGDRYFLVALPGYLKNIIVETPNDDIVSVIDSIELVSLSGTESNILSGGRSADSIGTIPYSLDGNILANIAAQETLRLNNGELGALVYRERVQANGFPGDVILRRQFEIGQTIETSLTALRSPIFYDDSLAISIITPVYNVEPKWLQLLIDSVVGQTHGSWKLILVDDGSTRHDLLSFLDQVESIDGRITLIKRSYNGGISAATNDGLTFVTTKYFALVDNDDILINNALAECAAVIKEDRSVDWIYTDDFYIDEAGHVCGLFPKPDWSPYMLFNYMYTGHLSVYRTAIVKSVGGFRSEYDFSQDYDLALRLAETTPKVVHVDKYLYGWRTLSSSAAAGGKPTARLSNIAALQDALDRRDFKAQAIGLPTANRAQFDSSDFNGLVSIIIPSDNAEHIESSIDSIVSLTAYHKYEIIIVTNSRIISQFENAMKNHPYVFVPYDAKYNFSDKCNLGARRARGSYLIFFNDDVRVHSHDWVQGIIEYLSKPEVGIVGPKLLYENGMIQHAGMITGVRRFVGTAFHSMPADTNFHFNMAQCVREVSLICGALLAIRAETFLEVNGFDSKNVPIAHSDVDLCFRVREKGYSCIYTPHVSLLHIGHVSIGSEERSKPVTATSKDLSDLFIIDRFGPFLTRDPYFPPSMRDITYVDSQETFSFHGSRTRSYCDLNKSALIVSHDLTNSGAPRVALDMALALHEAGYFVIVISPDDGPLRQVLADYGITVIVDSLVLRQHDYLPQFARNFSLAICNTIVCWPAVKQISKMAKTYWYIHESGLVHEIAHQNPELRTILADPHRLLAVSPHTGSALAEYGVVFDLLETGVEDLYGRWKPNVEAQRVNIGLFGSFEPRKGQDILAHAFSLLPVNVRAMANLHFFGRHHDLPFEADVRAMWGAHDNMHFHGEARHPDYFQRMADMDVVVCPSRDDPLPLVLLDAMSMAKTIVCSRTTGTSAYLEHGISGFIAESNSSEEHAGLLHELILSSDKRSSTREGARQAYKKMFSKDAFKKRLFSYIEGDGRVLLSVEDEKASTS